MEIGFFSLFALSRKRTLHVLTTVTNKNMTWQSNRSVGIGFLKLSARLTLHQRRVSVAIFDYPMKQKLIIMDNSPVSGHRPDFSLVSAYGNNSRKRTAPLTDTFLNSRACPLTRELTVYAKCDTATFTTLAIEKPEKPCSSYCVTLYLWWGSRGNIKSITLGGGRVNVCYNG